MRNILYLFVITIITVGCNTRSKHMRIGINAEYAPYEYIENNEYTGFNIEVIKNVLSNAGYTYDFVNMKFDGLLAALQAQKVDVVIGVSPTEERKKYVDFTDPYSQDKQVLLVSSDKVKNYDINKLSGLKIGVVLGSIQEIMINNIDGVETKSYDNYTGALLELRNQKIDGVLISSVPASKYLKQNPDFIVLGEIIHTISSGYAFALKKGQDNILKELNSSISILKDNGIITKLQEKYELI